ncbi:hypothetical protein FJ250_05565 [bacterium]|nr:hypothetical protein [bacterium]
MNSIRAFLRGRGALALLLMIPAALLVGGCESDTTAPQDQAPPLNEQDAATQAGLIAMAIVDVGPELVNFSGPGKTEPPYSRSFTGDISGTVYLDFRLGGPSGPHATWATGTWARLFTAAGEPLSIAVGESGSAQLSLDITGDINRVADTAVINGGGTFSSGPYSATFTFTNLAVAATGYPSGGSMTFTSGSFRMTVAFNGTNLATVTVAGHGTWRVNLDTGAVTRVP